MNTNCYSKNVEKAINLLWEAAGKGDADAYFFLSKCYMGEKEIFPGFGFEKDDALAAEYLQHSLELGSVLALFVEQGIKGYKMNHRLFCRHYTPRELWDVIMERAEKGDLFAQAALGDIYFYLRLGRFWEVPYDLNNMFGNAWYIDGSKRFYNERCRRQNDTCKRRALCKCA